MRAGLPTLLLLSLLAGCGKGESVPPPSLGAASALRPHIVLKSGIEYDPGTAYVARTAPGGTPYVITALHLFCVDGHVESQIPGGQLEMRVSFINLSPFGGREIVATGRGSKVSSGYVRSNNKDLAGDVAAFEVDPATLKADVLILAAEDARVGETVWLLGDQENAKPQSQKLWTARVTEVSAQRTMVQTEATLSFDAFSGAPVVNGKGEVVGHLIAASASGLVAMTGVSGIRQRLSEAGIK